MDMNKIEENSRNRIWDKKKFITYLIWTFFIAWILQIVASIFARQGNTVLFSMILSVSMFAPLIGSVLAKIPLRGMGWKPKVKGNIRFILAAWFVPAVLTILGAALYYIILPERLDLTGEYLKLSAGEAVIEQLASQGITIPMYLIIGAVQAIAYAPWMNMFFAVGEEAGWRGAMQPMLYDRFGKSKGRIIGGLIWGAWHWPVIVLAGYEYGTGYWGEPFLGMALFCIITVVMGTLFDVVYEKTNCIWVPALAHGAVNAVAAIPMLVLDTDYMNQMTLGPAPVGIISVLPALLVAVRILLQKENQE